VGGGQRSASKPVAYAPPAVQEVEAVHSDALLALLRGAECGVGPAALAPHGAAFRLQYNATAARRPQGGEFPTTVTLLPLDAAAALDVGGVDGERRLRSCPLCALAADALPAGASSEERALKQSLKESHVALANQLEGGFTFRGARLAANIFTHTVPPSDCVAELHIFRKRLPLRLPHFPALRAQPNAAVAQFFPQSKSAKKAQKAKASKAAKAAGAGAGAGAAGAQEDDAEDAADGAAANGSAGVAEKEYVGDVWVAQLLLRLVPEHVRAADQAANSAGAVADEALCRVEFVAPAARFRAGPSALLQIALDFALASLQTPTRGAEPQPQQGKDEAATVRPVLPAQAAFGASAPAVSPSGAAAVSAVRRPTRLALWSDRCELCGVVGIGEEEDARPASAPNAVVPAPPASAAAVAAVKESATMGDAMRAVSSEQDASLRALGDLYATYALEDLRLNVFPYGHGRLLAHSWRDSRYSGVTPTVRQVSSRKEGQLQINIVVDDKNEGNADNESEENITVHRFLVL
jgi:hypothetical protein